MAAAPIHADKLTDLQKDGRDESNRLFSRLCIKVRKLKVTGAVLGE